MDNTKIKSWIIRPPPGTRFSIFGADIHLQFERGREGEVLDWLENWLETLRVQAAHEAKLEAERAKRAAAETEPPPAQKIELKNES